jgi:alpha-1,2-mannosyltransferase
VDRHPEDSGRSRLSNFGQPWEVVLFAWLPVIALGVVFFGELAWAHSLGDFSIFRAASKAVLRGHTPYLAVTAHGLAENDKFVYPPMTAILFAPVAVLPPGVGQIAMLVSTTIAIMAALRLLDVSDWRCYGVAVGSAPVLGAVALGALTPFLLLGAAAAWRYRNRAPATAAAVALTATAKLFLWPLWIWLVATRRLRAAVVAAGLALVLVLGGWAVIGFAGLTSYPHLLHVLADVEARQSYSISGLLRLSGWAAEALSVSLAVAVVLAVAIAARGEDGDRRAFTVAIAGSLAATPVLWLHYFGLVFVPIAIYRPRLSPLWLAPLGFWLTPFAHSDGSTAKTAFALALSAAVLGSAIRRPGARHGMLRTAA